MKRLRTLALALVGALQGGALGEDDPYHPYQFFERYWQEKTGPGAPPAPAPPGVEAPGPAPAPEKRAPLFLFPPELDFGVAVASGEDLFYLHEAFYRVEGGVWYRSGSWRAPWTRVPRGKLPPELLRRKLPEMRALRDREFRKYWEEKGSYRGRTLRPESVVRKPAGKRPN